MTKIFKRTVKKSSKIPKTMRYKKRITKRTNSGKLRKASIWKLEEMLMKGLVVKGEKTKFEEDVEFQKAIDEFDEFDGEFGEFEYAEKTNEFDNLKYQSSSEDGDGGEEEDLCGEMQNVTIIHGDEEDEEPGYYHSN